MYDINTEVRVIEMICIPTDHGYHDMYNRSYQLGLNDGQCKRLVDLMYAENVQNNSPMSLVGASKNVGDIIQLAGRPTGAASMPNGWLEQRIRFMLACSSRVGDNIELIHYIQGYSDCYDPSYRNTLDPSENYHINSITTVSRTNDPFNGGVSTRVMDTYNVVSSCPGDVGEYQLNDPTGDGVALARPSDILTTLHVESMYQDTEPNSLSINTSEMGSGGNVSRRVNADPVQYLTETINSVISAKSISGGYATVDTVLSNANSDVTECSILDNPFIFKLHTITNKLAPTTFTLNMLAMIDPTLSEDRRGESRITLINSENRPIRTDSNGLHNVSVDETQDMLNYSIESDLVQNFVNGLSSAMCNNFITVISGTVTNQCGSYVNIIADMESFLHGVDITTYGNNMDNYIRRILMPRLTLNNQRILSIVYSSDLMNDATIGISVDNAPEVIYRIPLFADSTFTPVISTPVDKATLVEDFRNITDVVMGINDQNDGGY